MIKTLIGQLFFSREKRNEIRKDLKGNQNF